MATSIETAYRNNLARLRKETKENCKAYAQKLRMPYGTILTLVTGKSVGNVKTWIKIERYFQRQDNKAEKAGITTDGEQGR